MDGLTVRSSVCFFVNQEYFLNVFEFDFSSLAVGQSFCQLVGNADSACQSVYTRLFGSCGGSGSSWSSGRGCSCGTGFAGFICIVDIVHD